MLKWTVAGAVIALLANVSLAQEHKAEGAAKPADTMMCPVSGHEVEEKTSFARYRGKRVYFCCSDCIGAFEKEPEKFAAKMKAQWAAEPAMRVQVKCPVTGQAPDYAVFHDAGDYDVYFANKDALAKFEKDEKAYAAKMDEAFTYQTKCPISGNEIKADAVEMIDGKPVYFCCKGCPATFKKDPGKYASKMDDMVKANRAAWEKAHAKP